MKVIRPELALFLRDAFSGERPHLPVEVELSERARRRVMTPSGHLLFYGLQGEEIEGWVEGPYFRRVQFSSLLPQEAPLEILLWPNERYPFPQGSTLLRGRVLAGGEGVAGARVRVETLFEELEMETDKAGRFILFPRQVEGRRLLRRNGRLYLPGPRGGRRLPLVVEAAGYPRKRRRIRWPVGEETRIEIEIER